MKGNPLVSILIPTYNREKLIGETLQSALNQSFTNYEIIIVDNKSKDKTYDILKEFSKEDNKIKLYQNEYNLGAVKNWKKCLQYSKGEYIKILWSDDLISREYLQKTVPILENNNDVVNGN